MLAAVWVEIPAKDVKRALKFYQSVFKLPSVEISDDGVRQTATLFGGDSQGKAGISLNQTRNFEPCDKGTLAYFDVSEHIEAALERVTAAGGKVVEGKTSMGSAGFYATVLDTEGNLLALYSSI